MRTEPVPVPVLLSDRPGTDAARSDWSAGDGLADRFGRVHTDLRISVTDRCNLRCTYCISEGPPSFHPREGLLTIEELERLARVARSLGISSIRLTGGEPLIRPGIVDIVARISALGFEDVALTTNGTRLARLAHSLVGAGLTRANVSCDSLRSDRYPLIRRRGSLGEVLDGMDVAEQAGLPKVKVNVVLIAGVNDDEVIDFADFARQTGREVRFIEFMPLDGDGQWHRGRVVPSASVIERISGVWRLERADDEPTRPAPATRFRFADGVGSIGVVASVTEPFCGTCNRLRVTADGAIRNCLFSDREVSVLGVLRRGGPDSEVALQFRRAVWAKQAGHGIGEPGFRPPVRAMWKIGG
jgi:cyclic pyranopterin phosphate synthase